MPVCSLLSLVSNAGFPLLIYSPLLFFVFLLSAAEECIADSDLNFLIPIAVGVALGFLIILVFISYIIGRRKSRTGYQSV